MTRIVRPDSGTLREYTRLTDRDRRFIKGQKYTLLSRRENLTTDARKGLKTLLAANKRLNTAYLLEESFGQLWDYHREGWARRFFEQWKAQLNGSLGEGGAGSRRPSKRGWTHRTPRCERCFSRP